MVEKVKSRDDYLVKTLVPAFEAFSAILIKVLVFIEVQIAEFGVRSIQFTGLI